MALWLVQFALLSSATAGEIWFDDLVTPPQPTADGLHALGRFVRQVVSDDPESVDPFPAGWREDKAPRIVFVSLSDGLRRAGVGCGADRGLAAALGKAIVAARRDFVDNEPIRWVRVDIVDQVLTLPGGTEPLPASQWSRLRTGLASNRQIGLALLPEELVANRLLYPKGDLRRAAVAVYLTRHPQRGRPADDGRRWDEGRVYRFTTIGVFHDEAGAVALARGVRHFDGSRKDEFDAAAEMGGRYLAQAVEQSGRFVYSYQPDSNSRSRQYNILRHAGSAYAILSVYQRTDAEPMLAAARRALAHLRSTVSPTRFRGQPLHGVVERSYIKLGGNALAILALTKYIEVTGDRTDLALAQQLAEFIVGVQGPNGRFVVHKARHFNGNASSTDFVSEYYPGETVLALMRLYAVDNDPRWLDAAAKSADYLINTRDRDSTLDTQIHDHWLLYGLNELHRSKPDPSYLAHTRRILATMHRAQHLANPADDWYGGYSVPPGATPTSTRTEGLASASQLLRDFGTEEQAAQALETTRLGAVFVLETQLLPEAAMFFPQPRRCVGGVPRSWADPEIRIDYVQHAISCWLAMADLLPDDAP